MTTFTWNKGDFGFSATFTLTDADGTAVSLADGAGNASVKFKMYLQGATTLSVNGTCTISDANNGICYYTVASGNLDTPGKYDALIEATWTNTPKKQTWRFDKIIVEPGAPVT